MQEETMKNFSTEARAGIRSQSKNMSKINHCKLCALASGLFLWATSNGAGAAEPKSAKTFIDYFQPMPILSPLTTNVWGAATVGPRDTKNGLEDVTLKQWDYWDGKIIKGPD